MEANLPMLRIKLLCIEYSEAAEMGANYRRTVPDPRWNFRAADTSIFGLHLEFAGAKTFQNGKSGMDAINWMPEVGSVYIESEDIPRLREHVAVSKEGGAESNGSLRNRPMVKCGLSAMMRSSGVWFHNRDAIEFTEGILWKICDGQYKGTFAVSLNSMPRGMFAAERISEKWPPSGNGESQL